MRRLWRRWLNICESIYPLRYKDDEYRFDYHVKCFLNNEKCETRERFCTEFIYKEKFYNDLKVEDNNKICFDYKGKCIEGYETCEDYEQNVDKTICENLIAGYYSEQKCVYDDLNKKCISENLSCSSMQIDLFKSFCEGIGLENNIKCFYSNGGCSLGGDETPDEKNSDANKNLDEIKNSDTINNPEKSSTSDERRLYFPKIFLIIYSLLMI